MVRRYAPCVKKAAKRSGISPSKLQKSYNRGIGAYRTNPGSVSPNVKSKEQIKLTNTTTIIIVQKTYIIYSEKKLIT